MRKEENLESKKYLFEKMPVSKAIGKMAIPTIISQLINLIYNLVDTIFIGRTGNPLMVSAITVVFTIFMMTISFSNLFGVGGGSLIARLIGKNEEQEASKVSAFSFYCGIGIALLYSFLIGTTMNPLLKALGASSDTILYAKQYVWIVVVAGNLPVILSTTIAHILRNTGYAKQASFGLSAGGVLNIILDPLFMFVLLPGGYEVVGAALATLISNIIACTYLLIMMIKVSKKTCLSMKFSDALKIRKKDVKELFAVGVPSAILSAMFDIGNIFLNKLSANHGDLELAAMGIVMKAERLPTSINIGLCQAMLPIVAYNYAAKNYERQKKVISTARIYGLIISAICIIMYIFLSKGVCKIFLSTDKGNIEDSVKVIDLASMYLSIRCLASPFQFLNFHSSFSMQAMGDGKDTLIHAIVRICILYIPIMFLFDYLFGMQGLCLALAVGELISDGLAILLLHRFQKKNILKKA